MTDKNRGGRPKNRWYACWAGDQYAEAGDTHYFDGAQYTYYWNEQRKRLRRYDMDGGYLEVGCRKRPQPGLVSSVVAMARRAGRLRAVEVAGVPLAA